MPGFDVLCRDLSLKESYFLEASAGCGKTFAITHLVVRFLLEGLQLDQILIVTFTKAATSELKSRVRSCIQEALMQLNQRQAEWDYLQNVLNKTTLEQQQAKQLLQKALAEFEIAKIFTIHGFCFQILKEHAVMTKISLDHDGESASPEIVKQMVKDYLRTGLSADDISLLQLEILLHDWRQDMPGLIAGLAKIASQKIPVCKTESYQELCNILRKESEVICSRYQLDPEILFQDLCQAALHYKNFCNREKKLKAEMQEGLRAFCTFFAGEAVDLTGSCVLKMTSEMRLKKGPSIDLKYPGLVEVLQSTIFPLIEKMSDPLRIFAHLAEKVRLYVSRVAESEELIFFDDLIHLVKKNIHNPALKDQLRRQFQAVLIDEFQDTDPIQWEIFSTLFKHPDYSGILILIGDPKQSIYRFRNADIYTYLKAKEGMRVATLNCNYRSDPTLLAALNALFTPVPDLFFIPQKQQFLECSATQAGIRENAHLQDQKKACHFFYGDDEAHLFAFIVEEIKYFVRHEKIPYKACAVLVKDRFQAFRFKKICEKEGIPVVCSKARVLAETFAFQLLEELVCALMDLKDRSSVLAILSGPFFCCTHHELNDKYELLLPTLYSYRALLEKEGILTCFQKILQDTGINILRQEAGEELYSDLCQLIEQGVEQASSLDEFAFFLKNLTFQDPDSDNNKTRKLADGVHIMTIHMSKGLEFSVVFPIGLMLTMQPKRTLILASNSSEWVFSDSIEEKYLEELDAEKMRQLYVAMTRAKSRLYIPLLKNTEDIHGSPLELFLRKRPIEDLIRQTDLFSVSDADSTILTHKIEQEMDVLELPSLPNLSFQQQKIYSFSSLITQKVGIHITQDEYDLPSGPSTGILLHEILEKIPFRKYADPAELRHEITPFLVGHALALFEEQIATILYTALHALLPSAQGPFSIAEVDPEKIQREMEFLFPTEEMGGFYKGFIDLFFEHRGIYYLLDWKSNFLGRGFEYYTSQKLKEAMDAHQYYQQAAIYQAALERYLDLFGKKKAFGGCYYLFLRGLQLDGSTGVFFSKSESLFPLH